MEEVYLASKKNEDVMRLQLHEMATVEVEDLDAGDCVMMKHHRWDPCRHFVPGFVDHACCWDQLLSNSHKEAPRLRRKLCFASLDKSLPAQTVDVDVVSLAIWELRSR